MWKTLPQKSHTTDRVIQKLFKVIMTSHRMSMTQEITVLPAKVKQVVSYLLCSQTS